MAATRVNPRQGRIVALILTAGVVALGALLATPARLVGAKSQDVPLVVYSAQGYDKNTVAAFQKATGIPTEIVDDSTGPLLARIAAEASNPQWGLLWVDGDEAFAALDRQGTLLKHFEPKVNWTAAAKKVIPADKSYIPTGFTLACALIYNSAVVSTPPSSWSQLTGAEWRGALGMNNPSVSGPTYPCVAGVLQHAGSVSAGERYFEQLKANGLVIHDVNGDTLNALQSGQIKLAMIQSSAAIGAAEDSSLKVAFLNPETLLPSVIGIDSKVSRQERLEAERFAEYVLSRPGQHQMQVGDPHGDSLYWPVLRGVNPLPALPQFAAVPYQVLNACSWGPREAALNNWFTNNIVS
ncbi:MAG TPA: extracellular solute-binding protein [Candidatus Dormibacteraeota bacterium]|nr:extracellular solute-binding protein [Candidatus Dormibacteraeota bacterium]